MRMPFRSTVPLFVLVLVILTAFYWLGVMQVPFHPDESTQIFNSGDLELFLRQPSALFWQADQKNDLRQHYRELDAPIPRLLMGLSRQIVGVPPVQADWDWSKTWQENQRAGAMPDPDQLLAARMGAAILFPFSLLFFFLAVRRATNDPTAWVAALLLASNALILLHTRRAMAEGSLLFGLCLTLWSLAYAEKRPWLVAAAAALAFCAKQTLVALAPVGLLAVIWLPALWGQGSRWFEKLRWMGKRVLLYGVVFIAIVVLLNPFIWRQPIQAVQAAVRARQALASAQTSDRPEQTLTSPAYKLIGLIGSIYLTPPSFAEAANYLAETKAAETAYLANPLHNLLRSIPAGGLLLVISLFGFGLGCAYTLRNHGQARAFSLLLITSLVQTLALFVLVPLPWQRYYLPAIPFACLWAAYGLNQLSISFAHQLREKKQRAHPARSAE